MALLQMRGTTGTVGYRRSDSAMAAVRASAIDRRSAACRGRGRDMGPRTFEQRQLGSHVVDLGRVKVGQSVQGVHLSMHPCLCCQCRRCCRGETRRSACRMRQRAGQRCMAAANAIEAIPAGFLASSNSSQLMALAVVSCYEQARGRQTGTSARPYAHTMSRRETGDVRRP